jgi:hypothetical protein
MRAFVLVPLLLPFAALSCTGMPGLDTPRVTLSPRLYLDRLGGGAAMQSLQGTTPVDNPSQSVGAFGQESDDEDWGLVIKAGDGFSGFEGEYRKIELEDADRGTLVADFGRLISGDDVDARFEMDAWRVAYFGEIAGRHREPDAEDDIELRLAGGAALTWRDGSFAATQSGGGLQQSFHLEDRGAAWLGLRGRVAWREASLDLDWLVNPDLSFGGNFDGWAQDVEVMARYRFPDQDVTVLAGYRWSELDASGTADGLRFDSEFSVTAIVLGIEFDF